MSDACNIRPSNTSSELSSHVSESFRGGTMSSNTYNNINAGFTFDQERLHRVIEAEKEEDPYDEKARDI